MAGWTSNRSDQWILAFTTLSTIEVRLPVADENTSLINITVYIRDMFDCAAEYDIGPVLVVPDSPEIIKLIDILQDRNNDVVTNPIIDLLTNSNEITIGQILISLAHELNRMNTQTIETMIASK